MSKLKLGQFIIGDSVIHQLDPRTKIIGCMLTISSTLFSANWLIILNNMCILVAAILLSGISALKFFSRMRKLAVLFALTFFFQSILTQGDSVLHIWKINFTKQGIALGTLTVFRLLIIYISSTILTITTSPMKLTSGMELLLSPLKALHVPVQQLSMIISISLRFIPTILEESESVKYAQKSRGAQFDSGNLFLKLKSISAVLIPILAMSLQRANDLAIAMESRCYSVNTSVNNTVGLRLVKKDAIAIGLVSLSFLICFIINGSWILLH